ncbi:right-handed parallel beta-helix repeat-containing protein [Humibacter ginsenosidimutans]|uniref:right-handed parallel beta-helix repeat-containing protein n=1 Tax=Humibacter ginsenosidimutans TaxID=2599293 RepID=UPI001FEEF32A|nr:right-handed parallel beta-helix repeat-containing protein [Humibacter ginsenosidimutans]
MRTRVQRARRSPCRLRRPAPYTLALGYSDGTGSTRTLTLTVDGTAQQISLPATADWDTWATQTTTVTLSAGSHTVSYSYGSGDNGNVNLDYLDVTAVGGSGSTPPPASTGPLFEAEDAALSGGAVVQSDHTGYSGTGFVGGYTDANAGTATTTFAVSIDTAGDQQLALRYANGTGSTRTLTLNVDGSAQQISLPATADWNTWATQTTTVSLSAADHTVAYSYGSGDNGNVNLDSLTVTPVDSTPPTSPPSTDAGASVPYDEYVASQQTTTGTVLTASTSYPSLASESTGRSAVQLTGTGQYVSFALQHAANSIVVRYSIPDNTDGSTARAPLAVYAGGTKVTDLSLTTKYSWLYGDGYNDTHSPSTGAAHHFYDETRALIGEQPAGTVIKLQKDAADTAASYTIDLVDTEEVAPAGSMPFGYTSITDYGVTPSNGADDTSAINNALAALSGTGTGLWFPAGTYDISGRIGFSGVAIKGAGEWYTTIQSTSENGSGGLYANGGVNSIADLSVFGDQTSRNDNSGAAGIEGSFSAGSTISDVWIEHTKVGIWTDGPTSGLTITGARVRDVFADGIHFNGGTSNTTAEQSDVRNTGDDGLALDTEGGDVTGCTLQDDTVSNVIQANGIGVYGGGDNTVSGNLVTDTVAYGAGITVSSRFGQAFDGTTTVTGNTLERTGSYNAEFGTDLGGIWIYADQSDLTQPIQLTDNTIYDSTYQGIFLMGGKQITNLTLAGDAISGAGTYGIDIAGVGGQLSVSDTTISAAADGVLHNNGSGFIINQGTGNSGI